MPAAGMDGQPATTPVPFAEKLRRAAAALSFLTKDGHNDHHDYDYASEASVKRRVRATLAEHGLLVMRVECETQPGSTPTAAVVHTRVYIGDADNLNVQWVDFAGVGGDQDKSGKAVMKAEAAAYKYALVQGFMIPTGDDPEGNPEADAMGAARPKRGRKRSAPAEASAAPTEASSKDDVW